MAFVEVGDEYQPTAAGTALRFADEWGHSIAWCEEMGKWITKQGVTWREDILVERTTRAQQTCLRQQIAHNANNMMQMRFIREMMEFAKPLLAVTLDMFDRQPWRLNTPGGVFDLQTGGFVDDGRGLHLLCTNAVPEEMPTPLWDRHLQMMCKGDVELIAFLKRLAGITLVGDQNLKPHVAPQLNGLGRNGKGAFLQTIGWALGDYSQFSSTRLLTTTENAHTTEQAGLRGMRLVVVEEVKRINSSLLKDLTGGGMMRARRMRMDDEEFLKSWTLWFNNNGPMMFSGDQSDGLWQRVPRIDLGEGIPERLRIADMAEQLKGEAPGVLNWAIEGLNEYRALGDLEVPQKVRLASEISRADADPILTFIRERYDLDEDSKVVASVFMRELTDWAKSTGEIALGGRRAVYDEIRSRTPLIIESGSSNKTYIKGLKSKKLSLEEMGFGPGGLGWEANLTEGRQ